MRKISLILACSFVAAFACAQMPQYPINADIQGEGNQWHIPTKVGNTIQINATMYQGTQTWNATGWTAKFRYGKSRNADLMSTITGVVSGSSITFQAATNDFAYPVENWYSTILIESNGYAVSSPEGLLTVKRAPEIDSGTLFQTYTINGNLYSFTGSFTNWPFLSDDDGTVTGDLAYFNGTKWTRLGSGTTGQVLTATATNLAPQWSSASGGDANVVVTQALHTASIASNSAALPLVNALSLDRPAFSVTSDGATITCAITNADGTSTLDYYFDSGIVSYVVPSNIVLTAGTTNSLQENWIYATPTAISVATSRPTGERAIMARINVMDAVTVQNNGPLTVQRYTETVDLPNERGRISHIGERVRQIGASWDNGMALSVTTNINGAAEDDLFLTTASGQAWQMHLQDYPAVTNVSGTQRYHVLNAQGGLQVITNLNQITADASGNATLNGNQRRFNIEIIAFINSGVSASEPDSVLGILLSTDDYGNEPSALADSDSFSVTTVDPALKGVAVRLATITLRRQGASGGTWTAIITNRRGQDLGVTSSGSGAGSQNTVFQDSAFRVVDDGDNSKEIALEASGITTAATRTLTVQDKDGTIALNDVDETFTHNVNVSSNLTVIKTVTAEQLTSTDDLTVTGDIIANRILPAASGDENLYVGRNAGFSASGLFSYAFGYSAGNNASGDSWTAIGHQSGQNASGSRWSTFGREAGLNGNTTNSMCIGAYAGLEARGDNVLFIDNYASSPGISPTNNSVYIDGDNAVLYLGRPTGTLDLRGISVDVGTVLDMNSNPITNVSSIALGSDVISGVTNALQDLTINGDLTVVSNLTVNGVTLNNPPSFKVYKNVLQTVTNSVVTKMIYQVEDWDIGDGWNTTSNIYIPPKNGKYFFSYNMTLDGVSDGVGVQPLIAVNNTNVLQLAFYTGAGSATPGISVTFMYDLTTNDYVETRLFHNDSTARNTDSSERKTSFQGYWIGE